MEHTEKVEMAAREDSSLGHTMLEEEEEEEPITAHQVLEASGAEEAPIQ